MRSGIPLRRRKRAKGRAWTRRISAPGPFATRVKTALVGTTSGTSGATLDQQTEAPPAQGQCSWPEGFREILGAAFQLHPTGQLREQPLQGPGPAAGHEFLGAPIEEEFALVDDDHPVANTLHDIEN